MTSRYAEDIRKIVGVKDTEGGLSPQTARESLPGTRGIGYIDSNGSTQSQSGGSKSVRQKDNATLAGQTGALSATNPDEALAGDGAAETDENGDPKDTASADALLDRSDVTGSIQALTDAFGNPINNKRTINEVTGVDCATGDDVSIGLVDDWTPQEATYFADGTVKSNAWDSADTPPEIAGFQLGFYWHLIGAGPGDPIDDATPSGAAGQGLARINATQTGDWSTSIFEPATGGPTPPITYTLVIERFDGAGNVTGQFNLLINRSLCPDIAGIACPLEAPLETQWDPDGPVKYKKSGEGTFSTSTFDPNAPVGTSNGTASINFCGSASGDFITMQAGANGNTLLYQTDTENGFMVDGTLAVIIGPDNTVVGYTDKQGLNSYTLK